MGTAAMGMNTRHHQSPAARPSGMGARRLRAMGTSGGPPMESDHRHRARHRATVLRSSLTIAWLATVFCLSACVSGAIDRDLERVHELSRAVQPLPDLPDDEVSGAAPSAVRDLLKAPLNAERAMRIAVLQNRALRAQLRELGVPRGRLMTASLLPNPVVEAELLPERDTQLEVTLGYDLTAALLSSARADALRPELAAARQRAAAAVLRTGYRARVAHYRLAAAIEQLRIAERAFDAYVASRDAARALHAAGNMFEADLATFELACEEARVRTALSELRVADRREVLSAVLGLHGAAADYEVQAGLPVVEDATWDREGLESRAIERSLDLKAMQERLRALSARSGYLSLSGKVPDVSFDLHALLGEPDTDEERDVRLGAGVTVGVPLFDRKQGALRETEAAFDGLLERMHGEAIAIRSTARRIGSRLTSAEGRAQAYAEVIVPAHKRIQRLTLLRYNAMQVSVFELLQAANALYGAETAQVDTALEYWTTKAALDTLLLGARVAVDPEQAMGAGAAPDLAADAGHG